MARWYHLIRFSPRVIDYCGNGNVPYNAGGVEL